MPFRSFVALRKMFARFCATQKVRRRKVRFFKRGEFFEGLEDRQLLSTFTVTNTLDNTSDGSLRWAIGQANSNAGADTINFDSTVFSTAQTITLSGAQLTLTDTTGATTITGPAAGLTISGNNASRVFRINSGVPASLSGLTITGGNENEDRGGGISNMGGTLTLNNCTISGNVDKWLGGGLYTTGVATLTNCTISGNTSLLGGGLYTAGTATITNCTISGNSAKNAGGIVIRGTSTKITSCTISQNASSNYGGGILTTDAFFTRTWPLTLSNTILSGNTSGSGSEIWGQITSLGNNLITAANGSEGWIDSDLVGPAAQLGALGWNGGATQTIALLPGSPAINAGSSTNALATDQRGYGRVGAYDIGAFEYGATAKTTTTTLASSANPSRTGESVTFTASVAGFGSNATGTITFKVGNSSLAPVPLSNGTASFSTSTLSLGTSAITAVYSGDTNYNSSTSEPYSQVVKIGTTTTLASSANPSKTGESVTFTATVTDGATGSVTFYDGPNTLGTSSINNGTATYTATALTSGYHRIRAQYTGTSTYYTSTSADLMQGVGVPFITTQPADTAVPIGSTATFTAEASGTPSPTVQWQSYGPTPTGTVLPRDTATQGNWKGVYGADGYYIFNDSFQKPSYADVSFNSYTSYTWFQNTTDVRALQKGAVGSTDRIASCYYASQGSSFTIHVDFTDGQSHKVSLYALDWDRARSDKYEVINSSTGTTIDTQTLTTFGDGVYLSWVLSGSVDIKVTGVVREAVASGLFFDSNICWANVPGETSGTYSFTTNPEDNGKKYRALFSNAAGTSISDAATLTLGTPADSAPAITTQPSNTSVNSGATATFTARASGWPTPTVIWQSSTNGTTWSDIADATSRTYSFTSAAGDNGKQFRAVFSNTGGTATTSAATLTVNAAPAVTTQPSDQAVAVGSTATFTAAASGAPTPTVQWQVGTPVGYLGTDTTTKGTWKGVYGAEGYYIANDSFQKPSYANVSFVNNALYTWSGSTTDARALQKGANGSTDRLASCYYSNSNFTIHVDFTDGQTHKLSLYAVDWDNYGRSNKFEVFNSTTSQLLDTQTLPSYSGGAWLSWALKGSVDIKVTTLTQSATISGVFFDSAWTNIAGATSPSYSFTPAKTDSGKRYRALFANSVGAATSDAATLTVTYAPVITTQPASITNFAGSTASFTAASDANPTATVQWQSSTNGTSWANIDGATSLTYSFTTSVGDNGTQYRAVFTNSVGSTNSNAATLTVGVLPAVTTQPANSVVIPGGTATFTAAATGTPAPTVQWQSSTNGTTWGNIDGATSTTYTTPATTLNDNGKQYRAVFTNSGGSATTSAATLTVGTNVVSANGSTLTVQVSGTNTGVISSSGGSFYNFSLSTGTWLVGAAAGITNNNGTISVTAANYSTINIITVGTGDSYTFANSSTNKYSSSINVSMASTNNVVTFMGTNAFTTSNGLSVTNSGAIAFQSGASLKTVDGSISLTANTNGASTGNNIGINIPSSTIQVTGSGNIVLNGTGTADGASTNSLFGVYVNASVVNTNTGNLSITGKGGGSSGNTGYDSGVNLYNSQVTSSAGGAVTLVGTGGAFGGSGQNHGVAVGGSTVSSAGGAVSVTGQGNGTNSNNYGVWVYGSQPITATAGGSVTVVGTGGGSGAGASNIGVFLESTTSTISAAGTGSVSITGRGGVSSGSWDIGVILRGTVSTVDGALTITGTGVGSGTAAEAYGIILQSGSQVGATGSGTVTAVGQAGKTSGDYETGVYVSGPTSKLFSTNGTLNVTGTGGGSGGSSSDYGVSLQGGGQLGATGSGNVTVTGQGGNTTGDWDIGVLVNDANSKLFSTSGALNVTGSGGGSGSARGGYGVGVQSGGQILSTGAGNVNVVGTGGTGTGGINWGVVVIGANATIKSTGGNLTLSGKEGVGSTSFGFRLGGLSTLSAPAGSISLNIDSLESDGTGVVTTNATTGTINLTQYTNGVGINLGSSSNVNGGPLTLDTTKLGRMTAGQITLGNANTGAVSVSAAVTSPANLVVAAAGGITPVGTTLVTATGKTLSFQSGAALNIGISGTTLGSGYNQLNVAGTVNLTNAGLNLSVSYQASNGTVFTIVSATSLTGTFNNLPEGAVLAYNGLAYRVNYTSTTATLTVVTAVAPSITSQPASTTVNAGTTVEFTAAASGTPTPTVQWQKSFNGTVWFSLYGATSPTYSFTPTPGDSGYQYRAVFTNSVGTATTSAATLTVNSAPAVTTQPASTTVVTGATATFTAAASGTPTPTVQWQVGTTLTSVGYLGKDFTTSGSWKGAYGTDGYYIANDATQKPSYANVSFVNNSLYTWAGSTTDTRALQKGANGSTDRIASSYLSNTNFTIHVDFTDNQIHKLSLYLLDWDRQNRAEKFEVFNSANNQLLDTQTPAGYGGGYWMSWTLQGSVDIKVTALNSNAVVSGVFFDSPTAFATIPGATSAAYSFTTAAGDSGKQYRAVFTNSLGTATTSAATLTVNVAPTITTQPASTTVEAGATATFTAAASGTPTPTVQWQSSPNGLNWSNIDGATSTTYSFTTSAGDQAKQFRAVFTNAVGTATTSAARLTVNTAPVITYSPSAYTTVFEGETVQFTAGASGTPTPAVQWQSSMDYGLSWNDINGANSTIYSFISTLADNGMEYQAVFSNGVGSPATTSAATLLVEAAGYTVTTEPADQTVNAGATATFTAAATGGTTPNVQWQVRTKGDINWTNIDGATSTTYSFTPSKADNGNLYQAVFTGPSGEAVTTAATLTVNYAPSITSDPADDTLESGSTAEFTASCDANPTASIQWQVSTNGGINWTNIDGATSTTYSFTAANADNGNLYQAVFTNSLGTVTSAAAILTVTYAPSITTEPSSPTVNAGDTITLTAASDASPTASVQWRVSTDDCVTWSDLQGATSTTYSFTAGTADNGNCYQAIFTNSEGEAITTAALVTVNYAPSVVTNPVTQAVTEGSTVEFTAAATGNPAPSVQWQMLASGEINWTNIDGATSTTYSFTASNADNGNQFRAVFTNSVGTVNTAAATLTVGLAPVITSSPADTAVNAGSTAAFTASCTGSPAPTVQWQIKTGSGTWTNIDGATSTTYTTGVLSASDNGTQYQAVFTNVLGSQTTQAATLSVNSLSITSQPTSLTVNAPSSASFTAIAVGTPTPSIQWQQSTNGGSTWTNVAGAIDESYTISTTAGTDNGSQFRAVISNAAGTITTNVATLTVRYAPVVASSPASTVVNAGQTATFTVAGNANPAPTVQWQISTNGGSSWANISGATSTSYTTSATAAGNDGTQYRAVFINSLGSAATSAATLKVNQAPSMTSQPASVTANTGTTVTFTASATGTPAPTVQWQVSTNSGATWSDISGATSTSYSVLATGNNGSQFRAVFTNTVGTVTSNAASLTIAAVAQVFSTSIGWGNQTANLVTNADGLRLLPVGRVNTIPWLNVNKITLTLDNPIASLAAGDISFKSTAGLSYSVQGISGSGTSWTITLANNGIVSPDKLTVTVANSSLASFSKRLDVLPGDVNDDGLVSSLDQLLVSRGLTGAYIAFYDVDGSGSLTADDVSKIKSRIGNRLPA